MVMRLTMCRMAGYHWDKYPSIQKVKIILSLYLTSTLLQFAKANYHSEAFQKVNHLVIKVVESGAGNLKDVM